MRMFTIPNQSSIPTAWKQFTSASTTTPVDEVLTDRKADRLIPSSNRNRLVDVLEELIKISCLLVPEKELLDDRFSEREEKREHGRLRTQAETDKANVVAKSLT